jgi:hypothetical protein
MKNYIGAYQAITSEDFVELALGTPPELWFGEENETAEERAARMDAAHDILADDPTMQARLKVLAAEARRAMNAGSGRASVLPFTPKVPRNKRLARLSHERRAA